MTNPVVDLVGNKTGRIIAGVSRSPRRPGSTRGRSVTRCSRRCAARRDRGIGDPLPPSLLERHRFIDRAPAWRQIHDPAVDGRCRRKRGAASCSTNCCACSSALVLRKRALEAETKGIVHDAARRARHAAARAAAVPAHRARSARAIDEIATDMAAPHPMHRLLQGDVGAGKTLVALSALLIAVEGRHQGALMAPTEVLAEQHPAACASSLPTLTVPDDNTLMGDRPVRIELLTNRTTGSERKRLLADLAAGTRRHRGRHACAHPRGRELRVARVGGHRRATSFRRRAARRVAREERQRSDARRARDDGDADPAHRGDDRLRRSRCLGARRAAAGPHADHHRVGANAARRRQRCGSTCATRSPAGRQVYVVCPLIEESETLEVRSAEETYARLSNDELAGLRLGLLHGRLTSAEKEQVMTLFRAGDARRARRDDGDRGRRRRAQRDRDGHPRRVSIRHRAAPPAARPRRPRRAAVVLLPGRRGHDPRRRRPASKRSSHRPTASRSPKSISTCAARAPSWVSVRRVATI